MAFNIENFKAEGLRRGGARPSQFEIEIPNGWPAASPDAVRQLKFMAKAASIPPSVIDSIDVAYFGRKVKVVGDRVFPNWNITVYNEEDFKLRNAFMNWHEKMNSKVPNLLDFATSDIQNYKRDILVRQYQKPGEIIFECKLVGAFPVTVDQIQLDWDAVNQFEMFDVEFAYDYWVGSSAGRDGSTNAIDILESPTGVIRN